MTRVEQVSAPDGSLVSEIVRAAHYEDTFLMRLPQGTFADVDALARACLRFPAWVRALMTLRNRIVAPFGLKTEAPAGAPRAQGDSFAQGEYAGVFRVFARRDDELLLGGDDRHLDFRFSLLLRQEETFQDVFATTTVQFHNLWGRLYFRVVAPFHRLVVPAMLRHALHAPA
jgi:hypothetical protein